MRGVYFMVCLMNDDCDATATSGFKYDDSLRYLLSHCDDLQDIKEANSEERQASA